MEPACCYLEGEAVVIELPYPHKALWPNGRAHWGKKAAETKKHRLWAKAATLNDPFRPAEPTGLTVTFYGKERGPMPDKDSCVASLKAYQDGIADAYSTGDSKFDAPVILFGGRTKHGMVMVHIR